MITAIISKELVTYYANGTPDEIRFKIENSESFSTWRYTDFGKKLTEDAIFMDPESILLIRSECEASPVEGL